MKCDHPLLCEFPILFSRKKVKLGHKFSQLIHKFNIWILKWWPGAVHISKFFSIHKEMWNWDFWKAQIAFPNFPNSLKVWKLKFLSLYLHIWSNSEGCLSVRWHVASNLIQRKEYQSFYVAKVLFPQVDEGFWLAILH